MRSVTRIHDELRRYDRTETNPKIMTTRMIIALHKIFKKLTQVVDNNSSEYKSEGRRHKKQQEQSTEQPRRRQKGKNLERTHAMPKPPSRSPDCYVAIIHDDPVSLSNLATSRSTIGVRGKALQQYTRRERARDRVDTYRSAHGRLDQPRKKTT
ncbi:unnamed protein product [Ectocarpus sp. 8 AP-2014]